MKVKPAGTISFLFTDVEGSTRLWEDHRPVMESALPRHDTIMQRAIAEHGGYVFSTGGDAFVVAFSRCSDAVQAAVAAQRALTAEPWPANVALRVRMGIHSGEAQERDGDYFGPTLNRAARLMSAGRGGQILISLASHELLVNSMPPGIELVDLGAHRLKDLREPELVWQVAGDGLSRRFEPLRTLNGVPGNLPMALSAFFGRDAEVAALRERLRRARLITLVGVGGVGKTRLALQVAADDAERHPDGVWFCDLAPVSEAAAVAFTLAATLGLPERSSGEVLDAIVAAFAPRRALIVIDNCEHVIDQAAELVGALVQQCPSLIVLATSREALAIDGEEVTPLKPLDPAGAAVVELFMDRARAAGAVVPEEAMGSVREISEHLDGIPLAVELAAARLRSMTAAEIAAALDHRFQLLGGSRRRAPGRHQTLKQTVDWSYAMLDPGDQALFDSLGAFAGSFEIDAAAAVGTLSPVSARQGLARLVERSLIEAEAAGTVTRYRLLETLRQYAHDRLVDTNRLEEISRAHALHFAELAQAARRGIRSPDEARWVERVDLELANFRAANSWAVAAGDADTALRILWGLWDDVQHRRRFEVGNWANDALSLASAADHPLKPVVLALEAQVSQMNGLQGLAAEQAERSIAEETRLGQPFFLHSRVVRAAALCYTGRPREAGELSDRDPVAAFDAYDDCWFRLTRAWLRNDSDPLAARLMADTLLIDARGLGVPTLLAWALYLRGTLYRRIDPPSALANLDEAIAIAGAVRAAYCADGAAIAAVSAMALAAGNEPRETLQRFHGLLRRQLDNGDHLRLPTTLRQLALYLAEAGHHVEAAVLRAAEPGFPSQPIPTTADPERHAAAIAAAHAHMDEATSRSCRERGQMLTVLDAARYAQHVIDEHLAQTTATARHR